MFKIVSDTILPNISVIDTTTMAQILDNKNNEETESDFFQKQKNILGIIIYQFLLIIN